MSCPGCFSAHPRGSNGGKKQWHHAEAASTTNAGHRDHLGSECKQTVAKPKETQPHSEWHTDCSGQRLADANCFRIDAAMNSATRRLGSFGVGYRVAIMRRSGHGSAKSRSSEGLWTHVNLTPREKDKLLIAMAANVARRRLERGV